MLLWCKSRALGICVMQQSKQLSVLELMGSKKKQTLFFLLYTICHHGNRLDALVSFMWMLLFWLCDGWMQFCFMVISNVLFKCGFSHFQVHFGTPPVLSFLFDSNNNVTSFCWKWWNKLCTLRFSTSAKLEGICEVYFIRICLKGRTEERNPRDLLISELC